MGRMTVPSCLLSRDPSGFAYSCVLSVLLLVVDLGGADVDLPRFFDLELLVDVLTGSPRAEHGGSFEVISAVLFVSTVP